MRRERTESASVLQTWFTRWGSGDWRWSLVFANGPVEITDAMVRTRRTRLADSRRIVAGSDGPQRLAGFS